MNSRNISYKLLVSLILQAFSVAFFIRFTDAECVTGNDTLPIDLAPETKLFLEIVNVTDKKFSPVPISYLYRKDSDLTVIRHESVNSIFIVKKDKIAVIKNDICVVKGKKDAKENPLLIDWPIDPNNTLILTLNDLFDVLKKIKYTKSTTDDKYQRYSTCQVVIKDQKNVTFDITVPDTGDLKLPIHVEIKIYEGKNDSKLTLSENIRFLQIATPFTPEDLQNLLPPRGVDCGNFNAESSKNLSLTFPNAFSFSSTYTNVSSGVKNYNHIFVDYTKKLVSFDYKEPLLDDAISSASNFVRGDYKIVHDFTTGLEYAVNRKDGSCNKVGPIPATGWGDVSAKEQNKTSTILSIRQTFNVLFGKDNVNFSYVGIRTANSVPFDVYISTFSDVFYEIWVSNKTGDEIIGTVLLFVYRKVNNKLVLSSEQNFYDFKRQDSLPLYMVDVKPCLTVAENYSYLLIELFSEKAIENITYEILKNKLRQELAERANVSLLRITDFFFQPVNQTILYAFFVLGDRSPVNGSQTAYFDPEITAALAHEKLNKSLTEHDLVIQVDNIQLKSNKDSLNFVPPFFLANNGTSGGGPPAPPAKSSKGGMAALAIFMLILGLAGGFGLAFFLYRRNRGIPYQIYE